MADATVPRSALEQPACPVCHDPNCCGWHEAPEQPNPWRDALVELVEALDNEPDQSDVRRASWTKWVERHNRALQRARALVKGTAND